jgi:hypothetical protein
MGRELESQLSAAQREIWQGLTSPRAIQDFLDTTTYSPEYANRSPLQVLQDRQSHCLDGGIFGAAALRRLGDPPLLVDLFPDPGRDDDHVLAIFKRHGRYGAVAKSNYAGLRYRDPVYLTLRELAMSYFESFYNIYAEKTLRTYTRPLNLKSLDQYDWMTTTSGADAIERRLLELPRIPLITPKMAAGLAKVDQRAFEAGRLGVNEAGLYQPKD